MASQTYNDMMNGKFDRIEELLDPMYKEMGKDLVKQKNRLGGDWAIAQAVFSRSQRDLLRKIIGPDLIFIVLNLTTQWFFIPFTKIELLVGFNGKSNIN